MKRVREGEKGRKEGRKGNREIGSEVRNEEERR